VLLSYKKCCTNNKTPTTFVIIAMSTEYTVGVGKTLAIATGATTGYYLRATNGTGTVGWNVGVQGETSAALLALGQSHPSSTGQGGLVSGASNTLVGTGAGLSLTTGSQNTAIGNNVLTGAVTTQGSTCIGQGSGVRDANFQTNIGFEAGQGLSNTQPAPFNTAIGYQAGKTRCEEGSTAIGFQANCGSYGCAIGAQASGLGFNSTAIGRFAATTGNNSISLGGICNAFGAVALNANCDSNGGVCWGGSIGGGNAFAAYIQSGEPGLNQAAVGVSNQRVTAVGSRSLYSMSTCQDIVAFGSDLCPQRSAGTDSSIRPGANNCVFIGSRQYSAGTGAASTAQIRLVLIGSDICTSEGGSPLSSVLIGGENFTVAGPSPTDVVAVGRGALQNAQTVSNTVALGRSALSAVTSSANNTAVGASSGLTLTTGAGNTLVGHNTNVDTAARSGCVVLGKDAITTADNELVVQLGGSGGNNLRTTLATPTVEVNTSSRYLAVSINGTAYKLLLA
jgi:hypothetical protein